MGQGRIDSARNRKGISIKASIRLWARQDATGLAVVEEPSASPARAACFSPAACPPAEAAARSTLLYAYVFGFSMMQCGRFDIVTTRPCVAVSVRIHCNA